MSTRTKGFIGALIIIAIPVFLLWPRAEQAVETQTDLPPVVAVTTANEFGGQTSVSLIGTVRAFSEAAVTAEGSGRVTSVPVSLGQSVQAGQVIATLENASERAAVLQAEGSYDAAVAAAAQSDIGTSEAEARLTAAENSVESAIDAAFSTTNGAILANVDQFFSDPNGFTPGLEISGQGNAGRLEDYRIEFQTILPEWKARTLALSNDSDLEAEVVYAKQNIAKTIDMVDTFLVVFGDQSGSSKYSQTELSTFGATFNGVRASLVQTNANLDSSLSGLAAAQEGLERAKLSGTGSQSSGADAQVKQALGGLRAAQANLSKTVLRSPISGTVNTLSVRTGDFVGAQQQIAEVANNDALEIVTAIGEQERDIFAVSDSVVIDRNVAGTVTEIAPSISPSTGKIEVRIAAESATLRNGDTVSVTKEATTTTDSRVFVPLSSVKFEQTDGNVFLVVDGALEARAVELGVVRGGLVEILAGLTKDEVFVKDARGLQPGTVVEVIQ